MSLILFVGFLIWWVLQDPPKIHFMRAYKGKKNQNIYQIIKQSISSFVSKFMQMIFSNHIYIFMQKVIIIIIFFIHKDYFNYLKIFIKPCNNSVITSTFQFQDKVSSKIYLAKNISIFFPVKLKFRGKRYNLCLN